MTETSVLSGIAIVTGLTAEARICRRLGPTLAGGGTPEGAAAAARLLVARGATALVSFGLAGGLDPALVPGTLVIPAEIVTAERRYQTDPALTRWLGGPAYTLFAGPEIVVTAGAKESLHEATGAHAIDLESGAVAAVATEYGIPFAALRAVCDPAGRTLPPAALIALSGAGRIVVARVAASVLRRPGQLADLLRLGRDAGVARAALVRKVAVLF
jgi:adenosylhomocysteine nucleosidase